jgi:hypothetical protein
MKNPIERFMSHVSIGFNCWEWIGSKYNNGYGTVRSNKIQMPAHRRAWILFKGHIPKGFHVLHSCDNKSCVRPEHLWLGTRSDNMKDCVKKGRWGSGTFGDRNGRAKLSWQDVVQIRSLYPIFTSRILASKFNVSQSTIQRIVSHKNWNQLTTCRTPRA